MTIRAQIAARLDELDPGPAVDALRSIIVNGHISIPGSGGMCIDCRWADPCPTIVGIAHSLGLITEGQIAAGVLHPEWDAARAAPSG